MEGDNFMRWAATEALTVAPFATMCTGSNVDLVIRYIRGTRRGEKVRHSTAGSRVAFRQITIYSSALPFNSRVYGHSRLL